MATVFSSTGGSSERAMVLLAEEKVSLETATRSELSLMDPDRMGWHTRSDLRPLREASDFSIWGSSPLSAPRRVEERAFEPPMIDGIWVERRVNRVRDRCINVTLSGVSGLSVAAGAYGLYEIYEKTETDLKILVFIPLCVLLVIGCGVSVYRGYLGCCRRA